MRRKYILIFLILNMSLLLTGCWSRKELNEISIASALGFDKTGDHYIVSAQIVNPGEIYSPPESGGFRPPISTYSAEGTTIAECIQKMTVETPRKIYLSHLWIVFISEEVARTGIQDILDFLNRSPEVRNDYDFLLIKNKRSIEAINNLTSLVKIPAYKLFFGLASCEKNWGITTRITMNEMIPAIVSQGKNPVIPGIYVSGSKNDIPSLEQTMASNDFKFSGIAAFKRDKLIGWLSDKESKGYNFIEGNIKSTIINIPVEGRKGIAIKIVRSQNKIKGNVQNKKPKIAIEITAEGDIGEVHTGLIDFSKPENIYPLEAKVNQEIYNYITAAIHKAQNQFQSDIFGFGEAIHRSNPNYWKSIANQWDKEFKNTKVTVNVDVKLRHTGSVSNSFMKDLIKPKD